MDPSANLVTNCCVTSRGAPTETCLHASETISTINSGDTKDRSRRTASMNRPVRLTFLFILQLCGFVIAQQAPVALLHKAVEFVKQNDVDPGPTLEQLQAGNIHTLFQVAKSMNAVDPITSTQIWQQLADDNHILSQVALGFAYSEEDIPRAIAYFVQAGENGPHQAALFNAGRLLVEMLDFPKALAYMRAAATLDSEYASPALTETCREAYQQLSQQIVQLQHLPLQDAADLFLYASLTDFPTPKSKEEKTWARAMKALQADNPKEASKQLEKLQGNKNLSALQVHVLKTLQAHVAQTINSEL